MKVNIGILLVLSSTIAFSCFSNSVNGMNKPSYNDILEQQLKIYETQKYIDNNEKEKENIDNEILILNKKVKKQKSLLDSQLKAAKKIILKMYGGEATMWIDMYMKLNNLDDFMTVQYISNKYAEEELSTLEKTNDNLKSMEKSENRMNDDKKKLNKMINDLNQNLKELNQSENYYKTELGMVDDIEKAKIEVSQLLSDWQIKGKPSFEEIFNVLANSIQDLPNAIGKNHIKTKGLFTYEISITDTELNHFLTNKDKIFEDMKFTFENNQLKFKGDYKGVNFEATGHYELKNGKQMFFFIDDLIFENVKLPKVTIEEMEKNYDLGFYPSDIIKGAQITSLKIDKGVMKADIKI